MKNAFFYIALFAMSMGMVACGSDENELEPDTQKEQNQPNQQNQQNQQSEQNLPTPDKGKDNYKDLVVTGGVEEFMMDYNGNISCDINGYVNLTDSLKLLYGSLIEFGLELSTDSTFPDRMIYSGYGTPYSLTTKIAGKLADNRRFVIHFDGLSPETKYFYRSYIQTGNNLPIYGSSDSFTTQSIEKYAEQLHLTPGTPDVAEQTSLQYLELDYSNASDCMGVFCSKDKSKLTLANIKKFINEHPAMFGQPTYSDYTPSYPVNYVFSISDSELSSYYSKSPYGNKQNLEMFVGKSSLPIESDERYGLEPDVTYYYCGFMAINKTPILGDIKQLKAKSKAGLLKVQITADDANKVWTVKMNSSLAISYRFYSYMMAENQDCSLHYYGEPTEYFGTGEKQIGYADFYGFGYDNDSWTYDNYTSMMRNLPSKDASLAQKIEFMEEYGSLINVLQESKIYYCLDVYAFVNGEDQELIKQEKRPLPLPDMTGMPDMSDIEGDGSQYNPYSVGAAFQKAVKEGKIENVYVKGVVTSEDDSNRINNYETANRIGLAHDKGAIFAVSDSPAKKYMIWGDFSYLGNRDWKEGERDVKIGDEVVVFCGSISAPSGNNTYAFVMYSYLYKFVNPESR